MKQTQKRGFDFTTLLLIVVVAVFFIGMFASPIDQPEFDWDAAISPVEIRFYSNWLGCSLEGISKDYTGEVLIIENRYSKDGKYFELDAIADNILDGTNIRHIKLNQIPENVSANAFAGVEDVVIYTDRRIKEDMEWAQQVTIRSEEDFTKLTDPHTRYEFVFSAEQLGNFAKRWIGDEKVMVGTTVSLALAMFLLCFLRQKSGRGNPLWRVFRSGIGKFLFTAFSYVVGIFTALLLFCEEVDIGLDVYGVVEFMLGWPVYVLAGIAVLFLLSDLISKDFPWFIARWAVRAAITVLIIMFCAAAGYVLAIIVSENVGLFKTLYILGLTAFVGIFFGGSVVADKGLKTRMKPYTVITESGEPVRVDYYTHGTYVGDDQIVGFGSDTMTGISGSIYKKH